MKEYPVYLKIYDVANPKYADLKRGEEVRVIGGDKGDVKFFGYIVLENKTVLYKPYLVTEWDLEPDEAQAIAEEILAYAYNDISLECIEHN